jgi:peptidoglycan-associated lipoprotein
MQATRRSIQNAARGGAVLALAILAGCGYAKRKDVDSQFATLRDEMQTAHTQIDERASQLDGRVNGLEGRLTAVESDLQSLRTEFNAKIEELEGKLAFNMPVNFEFNMADVRPEDQELLNRFAGVVKEHYPGAIVTVEGFADPSGSTAYNRRLGLRRAEAVRDYLVQQGLVADKIKTVSYGESQDRLVNEGRGPEAGQENRRVSLVIDYAEHGQAGQRVITE